MTGHPTGSLWFVAQLEGLPGRTLGPLKRGRKPTDKDGIMIGSLEIDLPVPVFSFSVFRIGGLFWVCGCESPAVGTLEFSVIVDRWDGDNVGAVSTHDEFFFWGWALVGGGLGWG